MAAWPGEAGESEAHGDSLFEGLEVGHSQSLSESGLSDEDLVEGTGRTPQAGKKVIAFAEAYNTTSYMLACEADEILLQHKGEIMLRGNTLMKGYLANEAATNDAFAGGWYRSGDLVQVYNLSDSTVSLRSTERRGPKISLV